MRIPIELKPHQDEILSSWLIRNSIANGSDPKSWTKGIWFSFRLWTRDIDRYIPKSKIVKLSKITTLSHQQVKDLTLELLIEKFSPEVPLNPNKSWYFVIPTGARGGIKTNGVHFCSECISEPKPYIKKQWKLAWNVSCPIHMQLLISKCEKCNHIFSPYKVDYLDTQIHICTNCGYDLRNSKIVKADKDVIVFQEKLNDAIINNKIDMSFPLVQQSLYELFITLRVLLSFFKAISKLSKHNDIFEKIKADKFDTSLIINKEAFESMKPKDRESLLLIVSKLFRFNIDKIKQIFEHSGIKYKTITQQLNARSKTIDYFAQDLATTVSSTISVDTHKEIKPRTKEEVEKLMDEIRPFI